VRFAVKAEQEGRAFVAVPALDLTEVLCVQEERVVGNDNCVAFLNRKLQIPESPLRAHFVRATVKVHQYPDGGLAIFHGRLCLGRYNCDGVLLDALRLQPGHRKSKTVVASCRQPGAVLEAVNRDRGAPRGATPPTPPGIRVRTTAVRRIKLPPASPWKTIQDHRSVCC
jgi:hypothetical protein